MQRPSRKRTKSSLLAAAAFCALGPGCSTLPSPPSLTDELQISQRWDWKTLETEHFRISFPAELEPMSRLAARHLEDAHRILSPTLRWEPKHKVQILIVDNQDSANGLTLALGRSGIVLIMKPPENWSSIASYEDWIRMLAIHEYTHYLNTDVTVGYSEPLRILFGDVPLPNSVWPGWMLEGLAVYMETRHTHGGRGRGSFYDMVVRTAVDENVLDRPDFITLDKVNGTNPYYPVGETEYLFGYELMRKVAMDRERPGPEGDAALGEMSYRSSDRIPYFINGNLQNITKKDWYDYWKEWVAEAKAHASVQIARIRSKPVTSFRKLTETGRTTLGSAYSPDGKWLAWIAETDEAGMGLFLRERATGRTRKVAHLIQGSTLAFTPDSRTVILSSLRQTTNHNLTSELMSYDLGRDELSELSSGWRASDPGLSPDGKWIAFVRTEHGTEHLAIAPLERDEKGRVRAGTPRDVALSADYDAIATPKFTPDGKRLVFTRHRNGQMSEELLEAEIATSQVKTLVSNGAFNRFPTIGKDGEIYFASNMTGVDNLYVLAPGAPSPVALTNLVSGLMFPSIGPEGQLTASVFATRGWNLAELELPRAPADSVPRVDPLPAPPTSPESQQPSSGTALSAEKAPLHDYSIWPTMAPREWSPILFYSPTSSTGLYLGAQLMGFDAIEKHRYFGALSYDTGVRFADLTLYYENRMAGPIISALGSTYTASAAFDASGNVLNVMRRNVLGASVAQPILWTFSSLTPALALNASQLATVQPGADPASGDVVARSRFTPSVDTLLTYSSTESSPFAITAEEGRQTRLGVRTYFGLGDPVFKGFFKDSEYLNLGRNHVLVPSIKGQYVTRLTDSGAAAVNTQGLTPVLLTQGATGDSLDQLVIRGYPYTLFLTRSAGVASLDWRFPIYRIFRGWGTQPVFLDRLYGFTFAEAAWFPLNETGIPVIGSAGGGLRLASEVFLRMPLIFSLEYQQGFQPALGGQGFLFFRIGMGTSNFGF